MLANALTLALPEKSTLPSVLTVVTHRISQFASLCLIAFAVIVALADIEPLKSLILIQLEFTETVLVILASASRSLIAS